MIEEILEVYRYMPTYEKIKGISLNDSYIFPYLSFGDKIDGYNVFVCMNLYTWRMF